MTLFTLSEGLVMVVIPTIGLVICSPRLRPLSHPHTRQQWKGSKIEGVTLPHQPVGVVQVPFATLPAHTASFVGPVSFKFFSSLC